MVGQNKPARVTQPMLSKHMFAVSLGDWPPNALSRLICCCRVPLQQQMKGHHQQKHQMELLKLCSLVTAISGLQAHFCQMLTQKVNQIDYHLISFVAW
eukprot:scaffold276549_cov22-Tisochrysis_lutea.AAC.2